jgi:hypothetical protein
MAQISTDYLSNHDRFPNLGNVQIRVTCRAAQTNEEFFFLFSTWAALLDLEFRISRAGVLSQKGCVL